MMVERRWPAWNGLAMLGDENSTMTLLPLPDLFVPYPFFFASERPSGSLSAPASSSERLAKCDSAEWSSSGVRCVCVLICSRTVRNRASVWRLK